MIEHSILCGVKGKKISLSGKSGISWAQVSYCGFDNALAGKGLGYIKFNLEGDTVKVSQGTQADHDGIFLVNKDNKVSLGLLLTLPGVIISDQFAGCDFQIMKPSQGILGAHVYSDKNCRDLMKNLPGGVKNVGIWESKGKALKTSQGLPRGGLVGVAYVSNSVAKVVWLKISGLGVIEDVQPDVSKTC